MREKKTPEQAPQPPLQPPGRQARVEDIHAMHEIAAQHRARAAQHEADARHTVASAEAQADELVRKAQDEAARLVRDAREQAAAYVAQATERATAQRTERDAEAAQERYWVELAEAEAVKAGLPSALPAELVSPDALVETRGDMPTVENGGMA